jgi:hypothetical protein
MRRFKHLPRVEWVKVWIIVLKAFRRLTQDVGHLLLAGRDRDEIGKVSEAVIEYS